MLSDALQSTISAVGTSALTESFIFLTSVLLITALVCKKSGRCSGFTQYTPTLLISLGVLGTFIGIIAGLLQFDTEQIDQSISTLLDGLKTAFMSSVVGMLGSILYRTLTTIPLFRPNKKTNATDHLTNKDFFHLMQRQTESLENLKKVISDDNEASLTGQLKLMRSDLNDHASIAKTQQQETVTVLNSIFKITQSQQEGFHAFEERLWLKLQAFADMLSKSATEQVIEALKTVIEDFNNNLTEQFGENFKQLNAAVLALVDWQENYKQQLAEMKYQYDQSVQAITNIESSVTHIADKTQTIPDAMEKLSQILTINRHQINELSNHLESFSVIRDKAVAALPEIQHQLNTTLTTANQACNDMAQGVKDGTNSIKAVVTAAIEDVDRINQSIADSATSHQKSIEKTQNTLNEMAKTLTQSGNDISSHLNTAINQMKQEMNQLVATWLSGNQELKDSYHKNSEALMQAQREMQLQLSDTVKDVALEQAREADKIFSQLDKTIEKTLEDATKSISGQINIIDKALEKEIENVMGSMGSALTSISGKFTEDYSKLVKQMHQITREVQNRELA